MRILRLFTFAVFFLLPIGFVNAQDWAGLKRYQRDNDTLKQKSIRPRVVYLGDSITDFWLRYSKEFFTQDNYANRGISGQTSPQMLVRFRADVVNLGPRAVVILCGTNDIAGNSGRMTAEMTMDNIKSMTEIAAP